MYLKFGSLQSIYFFNWILTLFYEISNILILGFVVSFNFKLKLRLILMSNMYSCMINFLYF